MANWEDADRGALLPDERARNLAPFIGRADELRELAAAIDRDRLVTVVGPGGCGKTRLTNELTERFDRSPRDGRQRWRVMLADVHDRDEVGPAIRAAVGGHEHPGRSAIDSAAARVGDTCGLLVLDNCEHLVDVIAEAVELLAAHCEALRFVATSRAPLGIEGEHLFRLRPMEAPAPSMVDATTLAAYDAAALFEDRARRTDPTFVLDDTNAPTVAALIRRLDGLPLAIELAAAHLRILDVDALLAGLDHRLRDLPLAGRRRPERHRTLDACIEWSQDLLGDVEQVVLRRASCFTGGFTIEALERVASGDGVAEGDVLSALTRLLDASLVHADTGRGRFTLLETVRAHMCELAARAGETDRLRDKHLAWCLRLAEAHADGLARAEQFDLLEQLEDERPNLLDAFAWAQERGDTNVEGRLAVALEWFWKLHGHTREGLQRLRRATCLTLGDDALLRRVRWSYADLLFWAGSFEESYAVAAGVLDDATRADDTWTAARASWSIGNIEAFLSVEAGARRAAAAAELASRSGDRWCETVALQLHALCVVCEPMAADLIEAAEANTRELGSLHLAAWNHATRARMGIVHGDLDGAQAAVEDGLATATAIRDPATIAMLTAAHVEVLLQRREPGEARRVANECLAFLETTGAIAFQPLLRLPAGLTDDPGGPSTAEPDLGSIIATTGAIGALIAGSPIARAAADDAFEAGRAYGDPWVVLAQQTISGLARVRDDLPGAETILHEALREANRLRLPVRESDALEAIALTASLRRQDARAARLSGAADAIRHRIGAGPALWSTALVRPSLAESRERLGPNEFQAAFDEGAGMGTDEAVAYARRTRGARGRPPSGWAALTPTEERVTELAATGLSNREIGERLFVSAGTVKTHLAHIYDKLEVRSRVELAGMVRGHPPAERRDETPNPRS